MKAYFHGECVISKSEISLPESAKKLKATNGQYIIANSETTGNHQGSSRRAN